MINPDSDDQNIPGLDDLLDSIRGESGRDNSSALAVYVPDEREEDLVSEQIDERILALLGLEDVIDIDYATYKTLLREKMIEGRMTESKLSSEETELLTEEFRRVKGNTGRFKVQKQKINFQSFVDDVKPEETEEQAQPQEPLLALPGTAEVKQEPEVEEEEKEDKMQGIQKFLGGISEKLAEIEKNLGDMLDMEAKEAAAEKKEVAKERVDAEKVKKRDRESKLESGVAGFAKKMTDTVTKPVKGFFESILNFFMQIFLGSVIQQLIKYIENPMMIFNPFIKMINFVIGLLNNVLNFVLGGLIEPINSIGGFINSGIEGLENSINGIMGLFGEQEEEEKTKLPRIPEAKVPQIPMIPLFEPKEEKKEEPVKGMAGGGLVVNGGPTFNVTQEISGYKEGGQVINQNVGGYSEGGQVTNINLGGVGGWKGGSMSVSPRVSGFKGGGEVKPIYNFLSPITGFVGGGSVPLNISNFRYEGGGSITSSSGQTVTGMGPDTQLIAAQPGEVVMSKKAVQAYGVNNLLAMNKNAGGTNIPTMGSVQGFQGGGLVSTVTFSAGHAPTRANYNRRIPYGADGQHVQGTQDTRTSDQYSPGGQMAGMNPTQVAEYEATMHLVDTMRSMVEGTPLARVIKFQNIETEGGLRAVPEAVEGAGGQFVDIHFDRRKYNTNKSTGAAGQGYMGAMMGSNRSAVDQALMAQYGEHPAYNPKNYGVIAGGGTILEMAAIDDPNIRPYLLEVKDRTQGPASQQMARKLLLATLNGVQGGQELKQHLGVEPGSPVTHTPIPGQPPQSTAGGQQDPKVTQVPGTPPPPFTEVEGVDPSNFAVFKSMSEGQRSRVMAAQVGDVLGDGTRVTAKMQFEMQKFEVGLAQHQKAVAAASVAPQPATAPQQTSVSQQPVVLAPSGQQPASSTQQTIPVPSIQAQQPSIITLPNGQQIQMPNTSGSMAGQKQVPAIGSRDLNNTEFLVIKSIYNIVG